MSKKLVPLYNKIIVELIKDEGDERTKSGLFIPNKPRPYRRGKVVGVGEGSYQNAQRIAMDVKEGDVVLFMNNAGMGVEFDESGTMPTKLILSDMDIWAKED